MEVIWPNNTAVKSLIANGYPANTKQEARQPGEPVHT